MKNYLILIVITSLLLTSCKKNSNYDDKFEIFNELLDRELNLAGWRGTPNSYAEDAKEGRKFHPFQTDELILTMRSDSTYTLIYDPSKSIVGVNQPPKKQNGKYIYRNGQITLDRPFFSSVEASSFDDGKYNKFFLIKEKINITADSIVELDFRTTSGSFEKFYVTYFILASSMTDNMDDIEDFDEFALNHLNSLELDYKKVTRYLKLLKINKSKQISKSNQIIIESENQKESIPDRFLGKYEGIQQSHYLKNQDNGKDVIINGDRIKIPPINYIIELKANNTVELQQTNLQDNEVQSYPTGNYIINYEDKKFLYLKCSSFGDEYSNLAFYLSIHKPSGKIIYSNIWQPEFLLSKICNSEMIVEPHYDDIVGLTTSKIKSTENISEGPLKEAFLKPQEIDIYDKTDLYYYDIDGKLLVQDISREFLIRMKLNDKEILLENIKKETSKYQRVYMGNGYKVVFNINKYGDCNGEGHQQVFGEIDLRYKGENFITAFEGSDTYYSSEECKNVGNG